MCSLSLFSSPNHTLLLVKNVPLGFPSVLLEWNGLLMVCDARLCPQVEPVRFELRLRSLKRLAPSQLTKCSSLRASRLSGLEFRLSARLGVWIEKLPPGGPGPRHPQGQKRHVLSRPGPKTCSFWTRDFMGGKGRKRAALGWRREVSDPLNGLV